MDEARNKEYLIKEVERLNIAYNKGHQKNKKWLPYNLPIHQFSIIPLIGTPEHKAFVNDYWLNEGVFSVEAIKDLQDHAADITCVFDNRASGNDKRFLFYPISSLFAENPDLNLR